MNSSDISSRDFYDFLQKFFGNSFMSFPKVPSDVSQKFLQGPQELFQDLPTSSSRNSLKFYPEFSESSCRNALRIPAGLPQKIQQKFHGDSPRISAALFRKSALQKFLRKIIGNFSWSLQGILYGVSRTLCRSFSEIPPGYNWELLQMFFGNLCRGS